ncbi:non-specific lipid-transfer protein-like protein At2g13820 [Asparagus officinalis]|uniref:non-specific lipid-transfer protein-like protein At2g13820 n=1 Tax=Asparagus officinalis TaxID=4686 RepID=UPI00098E6CB2|nr:non-specific lipid-transfer protein-like protein At2g13820 [Asparagus officinalis]
MATKVSCFLFLLSTCFTITAIAVASPPSSSSPPSPSCSDKIMSMMDCLDYIQEGSNASSPAAKCCDELKSVVSTSPGCLCEGFRMASDLGIKIDMARALKMPLACSVPLPPGVGDCTVTPAPGPAPVPGGECSAISMSCQSVA